MVRRILVATTAAVAATLLLVASAGAATVPPQGKVGPNQYFQGLVKGETGIGSPAVIQMNCAGPLRPGETGHPLGGQTVEVIRPPAIVVGHSGFTGANATSIVAFFGPPPPATGVVPPPHKSTVTFKRYAIEKLIPTSLVLPCSGTGNVYFVPLPMSPPNSYASTVPVVYASLP
jgi:hypothetical protein